MRLLAFEVEGYRSLRSLHLDVGALTVLAGENGVGKTNIFRALELLPAAASGTLCRKLAEEGGLRSVLWSGRAGEGARTIRLSAHFEAVAYRIEISEPSEQDAALGGEPVVREEQLFRLSPRSTTQVLRREGASIWLRDAAGKAHVYNRELLPSETAICSFRDSAQFPELAYVRQLMQEWRFYTSFRIDEHAPARKPGLAVATPSLAGNGEDLASVLATTYRLHQQPEAIARALDDAFPGATLVVDASNGQATYKLKLPDMDRPLAPHEISEGTLQYLCLIAALSSFRLPRLLALNEPETGLHPRLLAPLARLIARAARNTQICLVTHSGGLAHDIVQAASVVPRVDSKRDGATEDEPVPSFRAAPGATAQREPPPAPAGAVQAAAPAMAPPAAAPPAQPAPPPVVEPPRLAAAADGSGHRRALTEIAAMLLQIKDQPTLRRSLTPDLLSRLDYLQRIGAPVPDDVVRLVHQLHAEYQQPMNGR